MDDQNQAKETEELVTLDVTKFPTIAALECEYIKLAMKKAGGNKAKAAQILGVSVKTVYNKLHEYGMLGLQSKSE